MKQPKLVLFGLILGALSLTLANCTEDEDPRFQDNPETGWVQFDGDNNTMKVKHKVGDTTCPQKIGKLMIFKNGVNDTGNNIPDIDSVSARINHASINGFFGTPGMTYFGFADSLNSVEIEFEFNCASAESVNTNVPLVFYRGEDSMGQQIVNLQVEVFD
ncbi:MAG: hypothetical protein JJ975_00200 [Bacteroidia bacterium]|nr:hypothetical protein [Bacteroidia bacterium]